MNYWLRWSVTTSTSSIIQTIRVFNLARFVPRAMLPQLRAAVESTTDVEAANAALLLATYGDRPMADQVLALALDATRSASVRNSALAAYDQIGTPASVPQLLDIQNWNELTVLSRIDAAAGLMDSTNAPLVLAALGRTDAMISSVFDRFSELNDRADLEAVLDALIAFPRRCASASPTLLLPESVLVVSCAQLANRNGWTRLLSSS